MKFGIILVFLFSILFVSWISFAIYDNYFGNDALELEVYAHLESIAKSKANRIGFFLDERKDDLVFLANSKEVIDLMNINKITKSIDDKLRFFQETNSYLDLILIGIEGKVLWSANQKNLIGINLAENKDEDLAEVYNKVKNDFGVGVFDQSYYGFEEKLSVFITSPVLINSETIVGKKEMIGIIILQIENSQIEKMISSNVGILDLGGEIYSVNQDGVLTTSLFDKSNERIIKINSEMYKDCFKDYRNYYFKRQGQEIDFVKKSGIYKNPFGKKVFGAHQYILETGWCVMVEVDAEKFYDNLKSRRIEK